MSRRYALLIGNGNYDDDSLSKLTAPAADIHALAAVLKDPQIGNFQSINLLMDRTFAETQLAIAEFFAGKTKQDVLLFYFSGHGILDKTGRLYFAVKDSRRSLPSGSAIASHFLRDEMDLSRAGGRVLILDCCYSGAFGFGQKGEVASDKVINEETFLARGRESAVLTATNAIQPAYEGNQVINGLETSLFTHFIVEGIRSGNAADQDGRVTPSTLYGYIQKRISEVLPDQNPKLIGHVREGEELIIAYGNRASPTMANSSSEAMRDKTLDDYTAAKQVVKQNSEQATTDNQSQSGDSSSGGAETDSRGSLIARARGWTSHSPSRSPSRGSKSESPLSKAIRSRYGSR